ncbi:MAG TPA: aldehyde ferredoxin oxidoreductase C-terminal domain-containing protein [Candidatus Baltobacteraceae bacterium]|nr:aldehyde ferredoxin oxidoreductase C-terminal domain-containing protein [Candidatus Baltobacteraceae bacterium]
MEIWRANLHEQKVTREPVPQAWERLGGRGLSARILLDEVPPTCEPLGPFNKLVFAPGLLVGHMLSSCDRISVGAKSPMTRGIKEANAGGSTGLHMTNMGMKALILEGQAPAGDKKSGWWVLHLSLNGARFEPADDLAGLGVFEAAPRLLKRYGEKVAIALIGQSGEMLYAAAGIQNLDKDREPSRIASRGGLGAVMGSKRLKAIVFDDAGGKKPAVANPEAFKLAQKKFTKNLMDHPQSAVYRDYSTAAMTLTCNSFGGLPTRNFSSGRFEGAETLSGEHMHDTMVKRGGESEPAHACMAGCTIRCSNIYGGADGKAIVSPLEYETIGLMGSNLGIADLDYVAKMNQIANDIGVDTIDIGAALGIAAEAGLMEFGDGERAVELMEEIRKGTPLGRILGQGAGIAGRVLGVTRIPVVKGQAMSAYEPRAIKGTGTTYATSPQGADHTAGNTVRAKVDHLDPSVQAAASRTAQINMAGYDTLGACIFSGFGFAVAPEVIPDLLNARYGWQVGGDILQVLGKETLQIEREFNRRAGFTAADDRLPEWMTIEPLPPHNSTYDVPAADLDGMFNW